MRVAAAGPGAELEDQVRPPYESVALVRVTRPRGDPGGGGAVEQSDTPRAPLRWADARRAKEVCSVTLHLNLLPASRLRPGAAQPGIIANPLGSLP